MNPKSATFQALLGLADLSPANIEAARAIVRRKRRALVIAAALVLTLSTGCACATSSQDEVCTEATR